MLLIKTRRDTLLAPLQAVSGIVERRHTLPILSNVLLEKRGDVLTLLATDIEIQITSSSERATGDGDGAVTVGARKLQEILRSLPESAEVSLVLDDRRLQVKAGKSRFSLQTLPADDFPCLAMAEGEVKAFQCSAEGVPQLAGANSVRDGDSGRSLLPERSAAARRWRELRAVATDGHRLAYASMPLEDSPEALRADGATRQELILPRKTVIELNRLLSDSDEALVDRNAAQPDSFPVRPYQL
jgi:DNA polymerase-3 subunit beta